jgi:hypothetical protein
MVSVATRSLQSVVSPGGLVHTSPFDATSTILNKGVSRTLSQDGAVMFNYLSSNKFRRGIRSHPDMIAMGGWIDVLLRKGTPRA